MNKEQAYAQGARCGHLEGRCTYWTKAGQVHPEYVLGEEIELSHKAASAQELNDQFLTQEWAAGYRHGYKRAAEGSELEQVYRL